VHKLRPGHFLMWEDGKARIEQYWDVRYSAVESARPESDYVDELEDLLRAAVRRRLISDVPLGAFLSGGLDSSLIVAIMSRLGTGSPPKTFTIGFQESGYSETEDARRIATAFGTDHREFTVEPDAMAVLPDLIWHLDEPFGDSSALPTYYVSRMARQEVTVVLSGDGGDELFAGYHSYGLRARYDGYRAIPAILRRCLGSFGRQLPVSAAGRSLLIGIGELEKHLGGEQVCLYPLIKDRIYSREFAAKLAGTDPLESYAYWRNTPGDRLSRMQYLDTKVYLPEDILTKVDRMSMAVSLETRAPLLDYTLAEFAARVPPSLQMKDGRGKYLLRQLAARLLPPEALAKKKQGFAIPREQWLRREMKDWTAGLLGSERFRQRGYFRPGVVDQVLRAHQGGRDFSYWIWCLLVFEIWHRAFVDADTRRV
jgi:asparagine synthase (glutamine-hydrolysing)